MSASACFNSNIFHGEDCVDRDDRIGNKAWWRAQDRMISQLLKKWDP